MSMSRSTAASMAKDASDSFKSPARVLVRKNMVLPTVMATPSPARHDAAFTMMSLLNVQRIEADNETAPESVSVGHPMSPPQIRGKRSRGAKTRMSQPPQGERARKSARTSTAAPTARSTASKGRKPRGKDEYSRKDKSLGLLCEKFLTYYGSGQHSEVCLDIAASELGVERRRIYDIVNILESVGIVSRMAKNRYKWMGTETLDATLNRMRDAAVGDGQFVTAVNTARNQNNANTDSGSPKALAHATKRSDGAVVVAVSAGMMSSVVVPKLNAAAATTAPSTATTTTAAPATAAATKRGAAPKRDRSLGGLSERFVQIFLLGLETCTLEQVARILLGEECSASRLKTKVRRLYDIANVLCSLQLVEKVYLARKPAFQWRGAKGVPQLPASVGATSPSPAPPAAPATTTAAATTVSPADAVHGLGALAAAAPIPLHRPASALPGHVAGPQQAASPDCAPRRGRGGAGRGGHSASTSPASSVGTTGATRTSPALSAYPTPVVSHVGGGGAAPAPSVDSPATYPTPLGAMPTSAEAVIGKVAHGSRAQVVAGVGRKLPMTIAASAACAPATNVATASAPRMQHA